MQSNNNNNSGICLMHALPSHSYGELSKNVKLSLQPADIFHHAKCLHRTVAWLRSIGESTLLDKLWWCSYPEEPKMCLSPPFQITAMMTIKDSL